MVAGAGEAGGQCREPTTTLSGWRRFVDAAPAALDLLPDAAWAGLTAGTRTAYDEARISYHSELVVVATSTLREVTRQGRLLTLLNRREISARRGLIVSGPWATGKSTALKQLGRAHELMIRERHGGPDRIPVVYVTTPPRGSPRKLALESARFLGLPPVRTGWNTTDIADAVCQILIEARCDLVLVDEIHNLNLATSAGEDMSDHLKYFTEHLPATFVYAGIDVERSGLFTGVRGRQIAGRCVLAATGPFPCQQEWASLEAALRLHRHPPGTLTGLDQYLHQRAGGMIGSLSHLIRAGAITAILDGSEAITRDLLDTIPVDHAAQSLRDGAAWPCRTANHGKPPRCHGMSPRSPPRPPAPTCAGSRKLTTSVPKLSAATSPAAGETGQSRSASSRYSPACRPQHSSTPSPPPRASPACSTSARSRYTRTPPARPAGYAPSPTAQRCRNRSGAGHIQSRSYACVTGAGSDRPPPPPSHARATSPTSSRPTSSTCAWSAGSGGNR